MGITRANLNMDGKMSELIELFINQERIGDITSATPLIIELGILVKGESFLLKDKIVSENSFNLKIQHR